MLTNVGSLGYKQGIAPLCPPVRALGLFCFGRAEKRAVVDENDNIVVQTIASLVITADHRFGDAATWKKLYDCAIGYAQDPANFNPEDYKDAVPWDELEEKKKSE